MNLETSLVTAMVIVAAASLWFAPKAKTIPMFYKGENINGVQPSLVTLVLSQVTTWIFARSLMTSAVLGYYYGIAGALAYAAYYLSFFTGGKIIRHLRFGDKTNQSVQQFIETRFGKLGTRYYNLVVSLRLLSEVFANLIVVGLIFGAANSSTYTIVVIAVALLTLAYSMQGGLSASLKTDTLQASLVIMMTLALSVAMFANTEFSLAETVASSPQLTSPGWVLLAVALMQIWSYPLHDPVMMDRGFIADRDTTLRSFTLAGIISIAIILAFALLGVFAGLQRIGEESLIETINRLFSTPLVFLFNLTLIISAVSTLDSTLSSSAKLVTVDMKWLEPTLANGRKVMVAFTVGGCAFLFLGSKDLFAAVAVSGTASMFLTPMIFFNIFGGKDIQPWALTVSFISAITAASWYMLETSGYINWMQSLTGLEHKYSWLLVLCIGCLMISCAAFAIAMNKPNRLQSGVSSA